MIVDTKMIVNSMSVPSRMLNEIAANSPKYFSITAAGFQCIFVRVTPGFGPHISVVDRISAYFSDFRSQISDERCLDQFSHIYILNTDGIWYHCGVKKRPVGAINHYGKIERVKFEQVTNAKNITHEMKASLFS